LNRTRLFFEEGKKHQDLEARSGGEGSFLNHWQKGVEAKGRPAGRKKKGKERTKHPYGGLPSRKKFKTEKLRSSRVKELRREGGGSGENGILKNCSHTQKGSEFLGAAPERGKKERK